MNKEEILEASREENKNKDLVEYELLHKSGILSMKIGSVVVLILMILGFVIAKRFLFSPWIMHSIMVGSLYLNKYTYYKKKNYLYLSIAYYLLSVICFVGFIFALINY